MDGISRFPIIPATYRTPVLRGSVLFLSSGRSSDVTHEIARDIRCRGEAQRPHHLVHYSDICNRAVALTCGGPGYRPRDGSAATRTPHCQVNRSSLLTSQSRLASLLTCCSGIVFLTSADLQEAGDSVQRMRWELGSK